MSKDLDLFDNKIIVLYILNISKKPLTITQIVEYLEDFNDISYFDVLDYIEKLKDKQYIGQFLENNTILYAVTECGKNALSELLELIPGVDLYNLKKAIDKNMANVKTGYAINTQIIPKKDDEYKISCYIKDGNDELINISIYAATKEQAKNISKNWQEDGENIYSKLLSMLTKEDKNK